MQAELLFKIIEAIEVAYGRAPNRAGMEAVWLDLEKVPDGAYEGAKRRLITEFPRLPTAKQFLLVCKEEGERAKRRDYVLRRKMEGTRVKPGSGPPPLETQEERGDYGKRALEIAFAFDPERRRELVEAMARDYPGRGWEDP